uniref:Uncharacterized protein n=1 Tax=Arundo donax TaxID=35708 RepID=A0A0A8ZY07_ARUDO
MRDWYVMGFNQTNPYFSLKFSASFETYF